MSFGKRLTRLRKAQALTRAEAAALTDIFEDVYIRLETGQCDPTIHELSAIADGFQITTDLLLSRDSSFHDRLSGDEVELLTCYRRLNEDDKLTLLDELHDKNEAQENDVCM